MSRERQYRKKESEDQRPVAFTTSGGVPATKSSVVPPIRKQWPVVRGYPSCCHISLQRRKKRGFVKVEKPSGEA